jgi:hypothetical protein
MRATSKLIDHERAYFVRNIFKAVNDFLQMIVELRANNKAHGIAFSTRNEQFLQAPIVNLVGTLLDVDDLCGEGVETAGVSPDAAQERLPTRAALTAR